MHRFCFLPSAAPLKGISILSSVRFPPKLLFVLLVFFLLGKMHEKTAHYIQPRNRRRETEHTRFCPTHFSEMSLTWVCIRMRADATQTTPLPSVYYTCPPTPTPSPPLLTAGQSYRGRPHFLETWPISVPAANSRTGASNPFLLNCHTKHLDL